MLRVEVESICKTYDAMQRISWKQTNDCVNDEK